MRLKVSILRLAKEFCLECSKRNFLISLFALCHKRWFIEWIFTYLFFWLREKLYPEKSSTLRKSLPRRKSTLEKIHNSCPIFMKLGKNIHLMSALSFSNISLIGSKLWIFSGVDFFWGRLFLGVELFSG